MSEEEFYDDEEDIDLSALPDDELVEQMHDDLYNGLKEEIVEATQILLDRGWGPDKVLSDALVEGMRIVGIDFRDPNFEPAHLVGSDHDVDHGSWLPGESSLGLDDRDPSIEIGEDGVADVLGIIGDDLEAVCQKVEEEKGIPVIPVKSEGFKGNKRAGYKAACDAMFKLVGTGDTTEISPYSINILGDFNLAGEIWLIRQYFQRIGIEVVANITGDGRVADIQRA